MKESFQATNGPVTTINWTFAALYVCYSLGLMNRPFSPLFDVLSRFWSASWPYKSIKNCLKESSLWIWVVKASRISIHTLIFLIKHRKTRHWMLRKKPITQLFEGCSQGRAHHWTAENLQNPCRWLL